jgi:hypothetical protein
MVLGTQQASKCAWLAARAEALIVEYQQFRRSNSE